MCLLPVHQGAPQAKGVAPRPCVYPWKPQTQHHHPPAQRQAVSREKSQTAPSLPPAWPHPASAPHRSPRRQSSYFAPNPDSPSPRPNHQDQPITPPQGARRQTHRPTHTAKPRTPHCPECAQSRNSSQPPARQRSGHPASPRWQSLCHRRLNRLARPDLLLHGPKRTQRLPHHMPVAPAWHKATHPPNPYSRHLRGHRGLRPAQSAFLARPAHRPAQTLFLQPLNQTQRHRLPQGRTLIHQIGKSHRPDRQGFPPPANRSPACPARHPQPQRPLHMAHQARSRSRRFSPAHFQPVRREVPQHR